MLPLFSSAVRPAAVRCTSAVKQRPGIHDNVLPPKALVPRDGKLHSPYIEEMAVTRRFTVATLQTGQFLYLLRDSTGEAGSKSAVHEIS